MICGCGDDLRQTVSYLPLDELGESTSRMWKRDFREEHKDCNSEIKFTSWRLSRYIKS